MKKKSFLLFSLICTFSVSGQEVVSTQGESYANTNGSIDFTIGEVVINTISNGTYDITQGFHQSNWNFLGLEDYNPNYQAIIFPNPTENLINIWTSNFHRVTYSLFDGKGKLILQDVLSSEQTPVQVSQLAPGAYSLTLKSETQNLKTFKLVKIH